jgi:predicted nucleotidyltransferase
MNNALVDRVGVRAAGRLFAFAEKARAMSPVPVIEVLLFGSRARGDALRGSDWDVAVVVGDGDDRKAMRDARNLFADLALPDIATGFHLRPVVIRASEDSPDPDTWRVAPGLARNVKADGLLIA